MSEPKRALAAWLNARYWEERCAKAEGELARRDEQIAAAWDEGEAAGWGRANRKWSDEPDLQRATNPYRGAS